MSATCCPQYTIRLNVDDFKISKSQKKVLSNFLRYLQTGQKPNRFSNLENVEASQEPNNPINKRVYKVQKEITKKGDNSQKKKQIRKQRKLDKLTNQGINIYEYQQQRIQKEKNREKTFESLLNDILTHTKINENGHNLRMQIVKKNTDEFNQSKEESYKLFESYQRTIHNDKVLDVSGWNNFLVDSPIQHDKIHTNVPSFAEITEYGAYHQQYYLDEKLVAVGVIDILPNLFSAKYFYYDTSHAFLNMGVFSALNEIYTVQKFHKVLPNLKYYYMGYYIYTCPKMRYKEKYAPSELLCDETLKWMHCSEAIPKIEANQGKYTAFYERTEERPHIDLNQLSFNYLSNYHLSSITWEYLPQHPNYYRINSDEFKEALQEFVNLIGEIAYTIKIHLAQLSD
uniref:Arginyl-tRNA--protein transferase 1 n=1 Tax=Rhabditophanes sp. KR3021 TaxID=114890 RepID=A0AC35TU45_9BILA